MDFDEIIKRKKVCGYLQSVRAINEGYVETLVLAVDSDQQYKSDVYKIASKYNIDIVEKYTSAQLALAGNIRVKTCLIAILKG